MDEKKVIEALTLALYKAIYGGADDVYFAINDTLRAKKPVVRGLYSLLKKDIFKIRDEIDKMIFAVCEKKAVELYKKRKKDIDMMPKKLIERTILRVHRGVIERSIIEIIKSFIYCSDAGSACHNATNHIFYYVIPEDVDEDVRYYLAESLVMLLASVCERKAKEIEKVIEKMAEEIYEKYRNEISKIIENIPKVII